MSIDRTELKKNWFIVSQLVSRDFKLKYRRSVLGILWSVLNPFLMMLVLAAVFSYVFRGAGAEPFPVYLILGITFFQVLTDGTTGAMNSIIDNAPLIKKIRIEKLLFPLEKVLFALLNFAISLIAVVIVMVAYQVIPNWTIICLPLLLIYFIMFVLGIGLLLSAGAVFFRDVIHIWSVVITAWTYATPLFYSTSILPEWMVPIMNFNPMYHFVTYFRDITMWGTLPSFELNLICFGCGLVAFVLGLLVFRKTESKFILNV